MKSMVVRSLRELEIKDVPEPELTEETVIVDTKLTAIVRESVGIWNGSDPRVKTDNPDNPLYRGYPITLGGELVGEVVAVGAAVDGIMVGDRLAAWGHYNQRLQLHPDNCQKLSAKVDSEAGVSIFWSGTTLHVVRRAQIVLGDNVVVVGQGPLGLSVTRWAELAGSGQVIAVERVPERLALAERFGAMVTLNPDKVDVCQAVLELTDGRGADIVINATTSAEAFEFCMRLVRKKGRLVILSWHTQPVTIHDLTTDFYHKELEIIGSEANGPPGSLQSPWVRWTWPESMRYIERMIATGKFDPKPLITHRFPPERVVDALQLVEKHPQKVLKAVIEW